jgi:putative ABC transport system permease protein
MPAVAVLSEPLWSRLFDRDPAIIGKVLGLNRQPVTVVGVAPRGFRGLSLQESPDLFVPLAVVPRLAAGFLTRPGILDDRDTTWMRVAGRLQADVSPEQAERLVEALYAELHPRAAVSSTERIRLVSLARRAAGLDTSDDLRQFVAVLLGAAAVTLLLSCATVANLSLGRAERREREMAVRSALGASRRRLSRLVILETLGIGLAGGAAGVVVSQLCLGMLGAFSLPGAISVSELSISAHSGVLAFSVALGAATSLLVGLAPVRRMARLDPVGALRGSQGHASRQPLRSTLVALQVGACVALLAGGLAFGRAVRAAMAADLGFDTRRTAMLLVDPSLVRYSREETANLLSRSLEALDAAPWVRAAGWAAMRPLSGRMMWSIGIEPGNPTAPAGLDVDANVVTPGYFAALGIPLRAGRLFRGDDRAGAPPVALVSESFARRFLAGEDAVGRVIRLDSERAEARATIVGMVGDIRRGLERGVEPMLYLPIAQQPSMLDFDQTLFVSADTLPADEAAAAAAALLRQVDRHVPVSRPMSMRTHVSDAAMVYRMGFTLFALFATLAVVLTTCGIYAVVSAAVARRRREIGLRLALGAPPPAVSRLVVRQGVVPVVAGLVAGTLVFWASGRALEAFLLTVPIVDLTLIGGLIGGVTIVAGVAILVPLGRALAVDPAVALRQD